MEYKGHEEEIAIMESESEKKLLEITIKEEWNDNEIPEQSEKLDQDKNNCLNEKLDFDENVIRLYNCENCDSAFEFSKDLILHTESIHEGKNPFACSIYQKSFSQETDLHKHTCRNESDLKKGKKYKKYPFTCTICKKFFSQEIDFHKHTCRNGSDFSNTLFVKEYKCELCKAGFKSVDTLNFHKRSCSWVHERKNIMKDNIKVVRKQMKYLEEKGLYDNVFRPYNCKHCDSAFEFNKDLILHIESIHEGKKPFSCSICQKSFFQETDLHKHTCRNGADMQCEPCGVVFISAIRLKLHKDSCSMVHKGKNSPKDDITIVHEVSKKIEGETAFSKKKMKYSVEKKKVLESFNSSFPCIFCRRMFKRKSSMRQHINLTHENLTLGENSHECFTCHSRFGKKYDLIIHMKETHQEKEPFFCDNCDAKFSSHQKMIKHVKLVHWYLCEHCDDKFPTNEIRNEHAKLIHTKPLIHQSLYKKDSKIKNDKSCSDDDEIQVINFSKEDIDEITIEDE